MISRFPIFVTMISYTFFLTSVLTCVMLLFPYENKNKWSELPTSLLFVAETGPFQKTFFFTLGNNSQVSSLIILDKNLDELKQNMEKQ